MAENLFSTVLTVQTVFINVRQREAIIDEAASHKGDNGDSGGESAAAAEDRFCAKNRSCRARSKQRWGRRVTPTTGGGLQRAVDDYVELSFLGHCVGRIPI